MPSSDGYKSLTPMIFVQDIPTNHEVLWMLSESRQLRRPITSLVRQFFSGVDANQLGLLLTIEIVGVPKQPNFSCDHCSPPRLDKQNAHTGEVGYQGL